MADFKRIRTLNIIIIVIFALGFLLDLYGVCAFGDDPLTLITMPLMIVIYCLAFYVLIPHILVKSAMKKGTETVNSYTFTETKFTVNSSTEGMSGTSEVEYSGLVKATENKEFFYLYILKNQAFIVDKSGFTEQEIKELRTVIEQALDKKYKYIA